MCFYKMKNKSNNINFFTNTNNTILYLHDNKNNIIERIFRDKWSSKEIEVINEETNKSCFEDFNTIISNDNDFIKNREIISSTIKTPGYFTEQDNFGIKSNYLNEFLGSKTFLERKNLNKYKNQNVIDLLEKETPTINILLRNLFHNENNRMIENFINWLNVVSFKDTNQDIIFGFIGTNEIDQGQGRGKGVLIQLLNKVFSGLVVSVSNTNYEKNFNSNLMNKKIVVFDEVDFKRLNYSHIKDITGNKMFRVEFKGKEPIESKNVSSWLCFSNEHDLHNKITIDDRRFFIIRPNPKNESLKRIIEDKFNGDFILFQNKLHSEIDNFIHIISSVEGKVLSPIQLPSNGHRNYFKERNLVSVLNISEIYKTFKSDTFKKRLFNILDTISIFENNKQKEIVIYKNILDKGYINFKVFKGVFNLLQKNDYIPKTKKLNVEWELLKERLLKNDFMIKNIDTKQTKKFERYKDIICIKKEDYEPNKRKISSQLRTCFGKEKINLPDIEF